MGYLPAGIAFGVLAQVAGVPVWGTIMLSVVLYAGAAQYACLPMLSAGLPIGNIATNIAAINLRHVFYGMPLLQYLPKNKIAKTYCLFALTDETFSVMTSLPNESRQSLILPISLFNQSWWVLAGAIGVLIGNIATNIAAINLRHVFYGMPLLQYLPKNKIAKTYCLFALTDETFSVMTSLPNESRQSLILPISLFNQSWWVLAGAIGVM